MEGLLFYSCHCILALINGKIQPAILGEDLWAYSKLLCSKLNWWNCHKVCRTNRSPHYRFHSRRLRFACLWACEKVSHILAPSYIFQIGQLVVCFVAILVMDFICFCIGRRSMKSSLYQSVHSPLLPRNLHKIIPAWIKTPKRNSSLCVTATAPWAHLPLLLHIIATPPKCLRQQPGRYTKGVSYWPTSRHAEPWGVQANHLTWVNYTQLQQPAKVACFSFSRVIPAAIQMVSTCMGSWSWVCQHTMQATRQDL